MTVAVNWQAVFHGEEPHRTRLEEIPERPVARDVFVPTAGDQQHGRGRPLGVLGWREYLQRGRIVFIGALGPRRAVGPELHVLAVHRPSPDRSGQCHHA